MYGAVAWLVLLIHLFTVDADAFLLSLLLTPSLTALFALAVRARHAALAIFTAIAVISHAIAPPFFFMRREFYTYGGGFGAVKDFGFGVGEFLLIYSEVLVFLVATVLFSLLLRRLWPAQPAFRFVPAGLSGWSLGAGSRRRTAQLVGGFLLLIAAPLSIFMYNQRIGITGLEPQVLPYRLTGILTYFRLFIVPVIIFIGYALATRSLALTGVVLLYGAIAGFASSSRFIVMTTAMPLAIFALIDRRIARFVPIAVVTGVTFILVTGTRNYIYTERMPLTMLVTTTVTEYGLGGLSVFDVVGGIANRLWGPQDVVLAYQYSTPDRAEAIMDYFSGRAVVEDLTAEFYGLTLSGDAAAFGVGIGYVPWMILLGNRSLPILLCLAFVTALLLSATEWLAGRYAEARQPLLQVVSQPLAFLLVYFIYTSTLNWWYQASLLAALPLLFLRTSRVKHRDGPASVRPGDEAARARVLPELPPSVR